MDIAGCALPLNPIRDNLHERERNACPVLVYLLAMLGTVLAELELKSNGGAASAKRDQVGQTRRRGAHQ